MGQFTNIEDLRKWLEGGCGRNEPVAVEKPIVKSEPVKTPDKEPKLEERHVGDGKGTVVMAAVPYTYPMYVPSYACHLTPNVKDIDRIRDIIETQNTEATIGSKAFAKAQTMAYRITDMNKAYRRMAAAEMLHSPTLAEIFYNRYIEMTFGSTNQGEMP